MMCEPKVSVIVPIYKAEAYLHRCMDSLLQQTMSDFEMLLIDDGSPDNSGKICDEYAAKDARIRVIHQPNGGVSAARQKGLDEARGEYVIHADPDDWVEPDMLQQLYDKAKEEDADMVICDFWAVCTNRTFYSKQAPSSLNHEVVLCELFQQLHGSCWNKLVRRACYNKYHVKFPVGVSYCEDVFVNASLLLHDIKVVYLPKAFYHYDQVINANSIVRKFTLESFLDHERFACLMKDVLRGSAAEKIGMARIYYGLICRAFSAHIFSNSEFRKRCRPYIGYCMSGDKRVGLFLYFSCLGLYQVSFKLFRMLAGIKHLVVG